MYCSDCEVIYLPSSKGEYEGVAGHGCVAGLMKEKNMEMKEIDEYDEFLQSMSAIKKRAPSSEQIEVVTELLKGNNVIVDSVAGSGKTTTIEFISKSLLVKTLVLTYNARLKDETRQRLSGSHIEAHNYHAFGVRYFGKDCMTDKGLNRVIRERELFEDREIKMFDYELVIIDETQDINPTFLEIVRYIIDCCTYVPQFCILGDYKQCIYSYNKSDARFIHHIDSLLEIQLPEESTFVVGLNANWVRRKLSTTYRLTEECAEFVNKVFLKENRLVAVKSGTQPVIMTDNIWNPQNVLERLTTICQMGGFQPSDIMILAPSIKSQGLPVYRLTNLLSRMQFNMFVPTDDNAAIKPEEINGKLLVISYHQAKGLERKFVIVYGLDAGYNKYYVRDDSVDVNECPNAVYVALTRSSERLLVVLDEKSGIIPCADRALAAKYMTRGAVIIDKSVKNAATQQMIPGRAFDHLPNDVIDTAMGMLRWRQLRPATMKMNIPTIVVGNNNGGKNNAAVETCSDITGVAIPVYCFLKHGTELGIKNIKMKKVFDELGKKYNISLELDAKDTAQRMLMLGNCYSAHVSKYEHRLRQITKYDWLTNEDLRESAARVTKLINAEPTRSRTVEKKVTYGKPSRKKAEATSDNGETVSVATGRGTRKKAIEADQPAFTSEGYIDYLDSKYLYEFKCTGSLAPKHFLQTALYKFLNGSDMITARLYNIFSDELWELESTCEEILVAMKYVVEKRSQTVFEDVESYFEK